MMNETNQNIQIIIYSVDYFTALLSKVKQNLI